LAFGAQSGRRARALCKSQTERRGGQSPSAPFSRDHEGPYPNWTAVGWLAEFDFGIKVIARIRA
jgi:hypothetical protein